MSKPKTENCYMPPASRKPTSSRTHASESSFTKPEWQESSTICKILTHPAQFPRMWSAATWFSRKSRQNNHHNDLECVISLFEHHKLKALRQKEKMVYGRNTNRWQYSVKSISSTKYQQMSRWAAAKQSKQFSTWPQRGTAQQTSRQKCTQTKNKRTTTRHQHTSTIPKHTKRRSPISPTFPLPQTLKNNTKMYNV